MLKKQEWTGKSREAMIRYLVMETRYTADELNLMSNSRIRQWYSEEREINKEG